MSGWFETFYASLSPAEKRNWARRRRASIIEAEMYRRFFWLRWPIIHVIYSFWSSLIQEGFYQTIKPRWGAMTFAYLNDGMKPTLWHTLYMITHRPHAKFSGIYISGAPKSRAEAEQWENIWKKQREERERNAR